MNLSDPPASTSSVLGLKAHITAPSAGDPNLGPYESKTRKVIGNVQCGDDNVAQCLGILAVF